MENPANSTVMSLTLRQLREMFSRPFFWLVIAAAITLTSMAGPYYTLERFSLPERLVYWGTTITLSAAIMTALSVLAHRLTEARSSHWALVSTLAGVMGVLSVVMTIYLAEGLATGFAPGWFDLSRIPALLPYVAPSVVAVTLIVNAVISFQRATGPQPTAAPGLTALQRKLPSHLGHEVIAVQAQDHYVEVTTQQGSAMVLMRLSDVVDDLAPLGGLQVHRSWWINLAHIVAVEKGANGPELRLSSGQVIPVGRSFRKAFNAARAPVDG